ncbi:MAG TPA: hypothetical protein VLW50_24820 [Streptosporangiaceae bacterium]|nr:hypothetical protein [Streptosporangiaceae bacterium]
MATRVEGAGVGEGGEVVEDVVTGGLQPFVEAGGEVDEFAQVVGLVGIQDVADHVQSAVVQHGPGAFGEVPGDDEAALEVVAPRAVIRR